MSNGYRNNQPFIVTQVCFYHPKIPPPYSIIQHLSSNHRAGYWNIPNSEDFHSSPLLFTLFILSFGAFAPALEAMDGGGQEEAGHDGRQRHRDAGENDNEKVSEGQGDLALSETVLGELTERHATAVHR